MKIEDSEQIRERLQKEYKEKRVKIDELNKKISMLTVNTFESRFTYVFVASIIPWMGAILLTPTVVSLGLIPLNMVQPLFAVASTLIGISSERILNRKSRKKLREFSSSKTEKETFAEYSKYEIEKAKLKNACEILNKNCDYLLSNENMIKLLSPSYNATDRYADKRTKEELEHSIENIENILQINQQELDNATAKSILKNSSCNGIYKYGLVSNVSAFSILSALMSMMIYNMPIVYLNQVNPQFQLSLFGALAPALIGGLVCGGYGIKRRKDFASVTKNIVKELIDDTQPESNENSVEKLRLNICAIRLQLENEKQQLKNITSVTDSESDISDTLEKVEDKVFTCNEEFSIKSEQISEAIVPKLVKKPSK